MRIKVEALAISFDLLRHILYACVIENVYTTFYAIIILITLIIKYYSSCSFSLLLLLLLFRNHN